MRVQATINIASNATAAELKEAMSKVPDSAKISISTYRGDQRDPGYSTITFSWNI